MTRPIEDVVKDLDDSIPRSAVSERDGGGGRTLSYLAGHYVIDRLNKVFGPLGWASATTRLDCVHGGEHFKYGKTEKRVFVAHYIAQVRLVVEVEHKKTEHTCTGYGDGEDAYNPGKAHELAVKEAETDALKRCAKNLGQSMGLALYDRDQPKVYDDAPQAGTLPVTETDTQAGIADVTKQQAAPAQGASASPAVDRDFLNKQLTGLSKIVNSKGVKTLAEIKAYMFEFYGAKTKEELSDAQAEQFVGDLKRLAGA